MSLRGRSYSILIVSAAGSLTSAFADLLPEARYSPVRTVSSISAARRAAAAKAYDFVIINSPLPDDMGVRFAIDLCSSRQSVVLLLVKSDLHNGSKPISKTTMTYALSWLESARERLRQFEKKSLSIEEKMAEIRLVNKAKWLLISQLSMSEPEAHRYIEKQAMDRCVTRQTIAGEIIKTYS